MDWLVYVAVGVLLLGGSALYTNFLVRRRWGHVTEMSMELSKGTGVVPSWVSVVGLAGWGLIVVGGVWGVAKLF